MLNIKPEELDVKLQRFYEKELLRKDIDLSRTVLRDPKHHSENFTDIGTFVKPNQFKLKEKIMLGLLHWYCSDEIRFSINLFLEENWGRERRELKAVLLSSKRNALAWIIIQKEFNESDFFGNYLSKNQFNNFFRLRFKIEQKKQNLRKYTGWCRGPQDYSSRVDNLTKRVRFRESEEDYTLRIQEDFEFQHLVDSLFSEIQEYYDKLIS